MLPLQAFFDLTTHAVRLPKLEAHSRTRTQSQVSGQLQERQTRKDALDALHQQEDLAQTQRAAAETLHKLEVGAASCACPPLRECPLQPLSSCARGHSPAMPTITKHATPRCGPRQTCSSQLAGCGASAAAPAASLGSGADQVANGPLVLRPC